MNRDDQSPADSATHSPTERDAEASPPAPADDEPTTERPHPQGPVDPSRRSLAESWAALASPVLGDVLPPDDSSDGLPAIDLLENYETPSIHVAVSDALDGAIDPTPVPEAHESVDDGILPPPPDRSGTSFGTWDPEGDDRDRPEFFGDITDETSSSAPDWRSRLVEARAAESARRPVLELGDVDDDDATPIDADPLAGDPLDEAAIDDHTEEPITAGASASIRSPFLDVVDDDDDDDAPLTAPASPAPAAEEIPAPVSAEAAPVSAEAAPVAPTPVAPTPITPAPVATIPVLRRSSVTPKDDQTEPAAATVAPAAPPERIQTAFTPPTGALPTLTWTPIAVDDIDDDEEDEEAALLALRDGERRVKVTRDDDDAGDSDALRPRSRVISGEIIDDHQLGQVADDDDDAPLAAPASDAAGSAESEDVIAPPRPREAWIADESDPDASVYGDPFPADRWQDPAGLRDRALLGRYRLGEVLGDGDGFRVHAAVTTVDERPLVVKILGPEHPASDERALLFRREARVMARLDHPRVVEVIDVGTTRDGLSFMVCARIDGPSLAAVLDRDGHLGWQRAVPIIRQVLEVTEAVQHRGFVHRTIQPDNCYLAGEIDGVPQVVLTNVGVTPLCTTHRRADGTLAITTEGLLGAAEFMAPEVVSGNLPDHHSDIYALGVLFFELLVGAPPFTAESLIDLLKKHLYEAPPAPRSFPHGVDIPDVFEAVILRALAKVPGERYPTVRDFIDDLAAAEARIHELDRAKILLAGTDAALWGDESDGGEVPREEPEESGSLGRPPIAPLTDDDKPVGERTGLPRTTAQLPAIPDREPPRTAPPSLLIPAAELPPPTNQPTRNLLILVGALALLIGVLVIFRPASTIEPAPKKIASAASHGPEGTPPEGDTNPETNPETRPGPKTTAGAAAEVTPPDPSEGALDPSEGALDPSEGALDPSEGLDPSDGTPPPDPSGEAPDTAPDEAPTSDGDPAPTKKKPSGPSDALPSSTIHGRLGAVRSRVSKECGMSGGLFAPVGLSVKLSVSVDPSGKATATPTGGATKMGQCAAKIAEGVRFPATRRGGSAVHTFKL